MICKQYKTCLYFMGGFFMSRKHSWFSVLVALLVALVIPFTFLGGWILAADETEVYRVKGYNQYGNIKDSEGNVIPCVGYCLDFNNHIPESNIYRRHKLSDSSYTDDQKAILLALTYDPEDFRGFLKDLGDESVVAKLFDEIGPKYADRQGGYTRILKLGPRQGDNAEMVFLELV